MSVYKDEKRNSWYVKFRYVDYYGVKKQTTKRGFATKREASEWETTEKLKRNFNLDMTFSKFYEIYEADVRHRVKETTWENKETMVKAKIIPFFGERKMIEISAKDVMETVERLVKECETYENCNDQNKNKCDMNIVVDVNKGELQELVENINSIVTGLKETKDLSNKYDSVSQKIEKLQSDFNKKEGKKVLKEYRELMASIEIKSKDVDSAISKIEVYERKKEQFLKKNSYTSDAKDYMDTNLEILAKVRDEIKRDKELNVLKIKKLDSGNISKVKKSISNMGKVISEMESLITLESTEEDRNNYSIFENLKDFIDSGVLSQVLENPENVSKNTLSGSNLPSTLKGKKNNSLSKEIKNKCVNALYAGLKFGNYNNPGKNTVLKYELEYIISGKDSDKENLASVVEKIVLAKTGINMAILTSSP